MTDLISAPLTLVPATSLDNLQEQAVAAPPEPQDEPQRRDPTQHPLFRFYDLRTYKDVIVYDHDEFGQVEAFHTESKLDVEATLEQQDAFLERKFARQRAKLASPNTVITPAVDNRASRRQVELAARKAQFPRPMRRRFAEARRKFNLVKAGKTG